MTREEEIIEQAKHVEQETKVIDIVLKAHCVNSTYGVGFLEGAMWADEHPDLLNILADRRFMIDKACEWLNNFNAYRLCLEGHKDHFIELFRKAMEE